MYNFSQKSFSPSAKIIYFSSLHHCEYSHFSIKPQSPTQVGFFENAPLPQGGWASGPEGLWDNQDICLYGGRTLLSWEAAQATCGGHPTLVILVHLLFYSDSFHFRPGISREVLQHWDQNSVMCSQLPQANDLLSLKPEVAPSMGQNLM